MRELITSLYAHKVCNGLILITGSGLSYSKDVWNKFPCFPNSDSRFWNNKYASIDKENSYFTTIRNWSTYFTSRTNNNLSVWDDIYRICGDTVGLLF